MYFFVHSRENPERLMTLFILNTDIPFSLGSFDVKRKKSVTTTQKSVLHVNTNVQITFDILLHHQAFSQFVSVFYRVKSVVIAPLVAL